jgi:hypothetical protein
MINAVLVFNNNGQPRLTKFYTQLVRKATMNPTTTACRKPADAPTRTQQCNNA